MIAVLGAGGVGGLVAGALARAHEDVVLVARTPPAQLHVRSALLGEFTVSPPAVERLDRPVETLIVATKADGLGGAIARVETPPALVVPLLNGVEHLARLRGHFSCVCAGVIRVQAERVAVGEIVHTSDFARIDLAPPGPEVDAAAAALTNGGLEVRVEASEPDVMWAKLVRLAPLALATTAFDRDLGPIRATPELRDELVAALRETAAVARAEGAGVTAARVVAEIGELPATASSSMRRDVAAGRAGELDAIAGAVVRAGARHGLACPAVERLAQQVRGRLGS